MIAFLTAWGTEIIFAVTGVVVGLIIKHYAKKMTNKFEEYKVLVEEKEAQEIETQISMAIKPLQDQLNQIQNNIQTQIDSALIPIRTQITKLELDLKETQVKELQHLEVIRDSYRFRLISLCEHYLEQGYMTTENYRQLSEMYKIYTALGGNGQAKGLFEKTCQLQIHDD